MEDRFILDLYHNRDERAISESKHKYGNYCYRIAYRILENHEDAEECVADAMLRAWNAIPPAKPDSLASYLATITRNLSYDEYRRRHQHKRGSGEVPLALDEIGEIFSDAKTPEQAFHQKELAHIVNRFLATLSDRDRNILLARYYFVYPIKEIAEKHQKSPKYVRIVLTRTLEKFKKFLEKENYL